MNRKLIYFMFGVVFLGLATISQATDEYASRLFVVNESNDIEVYGGGKIDSGTGEREYALELLSTVGVDDVYWVDTGDLDGDGLLEVVYSPSGLPGGYLEQDPEDIAHYDLYRYELDTNGNLVFQGAIPQGPWARKGRTAIIIGDFDGDEYDDLVMMCQGDPATYGSGRNNTRWYECDSLPGEPFSMAFRVGDNLLSNYSVCGVVGDLDHKRGNDMLFSTGTSLHWREADGNNGQYYVGSDYRTSVKHIVDMCMGDLDGDEDSDIVWIRNANQLNETDNGYIDANGVIEWMEMNRSTIPPVFQARVNWEYDFISVDIGDADGDGRNEVIATKADGTVRWFSVVRKNVVDQYGYIRGTIGGKPLDHFAGVDDFVRVALASSDTPPCDLGMNDADLNNDCAVDLLDFGCLAETWLVATYKENDYNEHPLGDIDYSTFVDLSDYAAFYGEWQAVNGEPNSP